MYKEKEKILHNIRVACQILESESIYDSYDAITILTKILQMYKGWSQNKVKTFFVDFDKAKD